jgi:mannose-6-phosphate isomerase class I
MIVLCLEGEIRVLAGKAEETLAAGDAVFVEDTDGRARLSGTGRFAIARTPA